MSHTVDSVQIYFHMNNLCRNRPCTLSMPAHVQPFLNFTFILFLAVLVVPFVQYTKYCRAHTRIPCYAVPCVTQLSLFVGQCVFLCLEFECVTPNCHQFKIPHTEV